MDEIIKFENDGKEVQLNLDANREEIWATQSQIVDIFEIDQSRVSRHIKNIFKDGEVDKKTNMRKAHIPNSDKPVNLYSLDVILSVGYRTDSKKAIIFRKWSNTVLKQYLVKGLAINQKRLDELNLMLDIFERSNVPELSGLSSIISNYTQALLFLENFDEHSLPNVSGTKDTWTLTYTEARVFLDSIASSDLFAKERTRQFKGILDQIYQGFSGMDFYPSVEEKAANLLYFIVKDHPFYDGNKRSAAALFVHFLYKNQALKNINNNTLAAIVLMVALSHPDEKENMILLIRNFLD